MFNFCLQLHAKDLAETLNKMYAQKKYNNPRKMKNATLYSKKLIKEAV